MKKRITRSRPTHHSTRIVPKRQRGHVLPRAPDISLNGPGRLRTAHILALCGFSHSTLYARQGEGTFPQPDGKDGGLNYWNTQTIKQYLES
jgi:predicted DNA-binding transcriptional regulator AlpA